MFAPSGLCIHRESPFPDFSETPFSEFPPETFHAQSAETSNLGKFFNAAVGPLADQVDSASSVALPSQSLKELNGYFLSESKAKQITLTSVSLEDPAWLRLPRRRNRGKTVASFVVESGGGRYKAAESFRLSKKKKPYRHGIPCRENLRANNMITLW
jgi:hypothetical protein